MTYSDRKFNFFWSLGIILSPVILFHVSSLILNNSLSLWIVSSISGLIAAVALIAGSESNRKSHNKSSLAPFGAATSTVFGLIFIKVGIVALFPGSLFLYLAVSEDNEKLGASIWKSGFYWSSVVVLAVVGVYLQLA